MSSWTEFYNIYYIVDTDTAYAHIGHISYGSHEEFVEAMVSQGLPAVFDYLKEPSGPREYDYTEEFSFFDQFPDLQVVAHVDPKLWGNDYPGFEIFDCGSSYPGRVAPFWVLKASNGNLVGVAVSPSKAAMDIESNVAVEPLPIQADDTQKYKELLDRASEWQDLYAGRGGRVGDDDDLDILNI